MREAQETPQNRISIPEVTMTGATGVEPNDIHFVPQGCLLTVSQLSSLGLEVPASRLSQFAGARPIVAGDGGAYEAAARTGASPQRLSSR